MIEAASTSQTITPEIARKCLGIVSKCMGEQAVKKLTVSLRHAVDVKAWMDSESESEGLDDVNLIVMKPNELPPLQNVPSWHQYVTASLWSLYSSSANIDEMVHETAVHMTNLGMKHPSEKNAVVRCRLTTLWYRKLYDGPNGGTGYIQEAHIFVEPKMDLPRPWAGGARSVRISPVDGTVQSRIPLTVRGGIRSGTGGALPHWRG